MMGPEDWARLHAAALGGMDRAWTAAEFASLLSLPGTLSLGGGRAALLARVVLDEAEVLTLATHPAERRRGLARGLLGAFHGEAARRGAAAAFLEVAEDNAPARALYAALGYAEAGRRPRYYARPGEAADALLLRRALP